MEIKNDSLTTIFGGQTVEVRYRDGTTEKVLVRQLPIEVIQHWAELQSDESALVELYCDRQDKARVATLASVASLGQRLTVMLADASIEDAIKITAELEKVRTRVLELNEKPRWASTLLPESHEEIVQLGQELNEPLFRRWAQDRRTALEAVTAMTNQLNLENSSPPAA